MEKLFYEAKPYLVILIGLLGLAGPSDVPGITRFFSVLAVVAAAFIVHQRRTYRHALATPTLNRYRFK